MQKGAYRKKLKIAYSFYHYEKMTVSIFFLFLFFLGIEFYVLGSYSVDICMSRTVKGLRFSLWYANRSAWFSNMEAGSKPETFRSEKKDFIAQGEDSNISIFMSILHSPSSMKARQMGQMNSYTCSGLH